MELQQCHENKRTRLEASERTMNCEGPKAGFEANDGLTYRRPAAVGRGSGRVPSAQVLCLPRPRPLQPRQPPSGCARCGAGVGKAQQHGEGRLSECWLVCHEPRGNGGVAHPGRVARGGRGCLAVARGFCGWHGSSLVSRKCGHMLDRHTPCYAYPPPTSLATVLGSSVLE